MKVELPVGPDLPQWFSLFRSEYANTVDGAFGSVTANAEGFDAYVTMSRTMERLDGQFPSAAEAIQAIVEFVNRQAKNNG
jgi:hypothetical protein